ncbi:alpha/beta fold hydrolase [Primorskyibacter aestuariivivens]|uniref:serine aminopeptidase domain-containing protein n=1 Tax=Primorskyibacter aestuariivivens TaxID=1888912 RepID=UPI0023014B5E|nr:alpha/beta hydrolase [Primorskyibacter aestuariivivens]MDA7427482.1 alpha/beta fold hydrolase [Primorskyibacter aestuariivivens]
MALLRVNAHGTEPVLHRSPQPVGPVIAQALENTPGPVTILVHGFRYRPGRVCPHEHIFALSPDPACRRVISWPRHLGYGHHGRDDPGVAICFGWNARGTVSGAYQRAITAGRALAKLASRIKAAHPARPVHVMGHSMGARVALRALCHACPGTFDVLVLLSAAEFTAPAQEALATPAGQSADILHVTSRENTVYNALLECFVAPETRGDRALGAFSGHPGRFRTVWIDDTETLSSLAALGFRIAPRDKRICHWSTYTRAGVFGLYRAVLSGKLPLSTLDAALPALRRDSPRASLLDSSSWRARWSTAERV